jgi:DNA-binding MarR family transcriptional regulator
MPLESAVKAAAPAAAPASDDDVAGYVLEAQVGHLLRRAHQRHAAIFQDGIGEAQLTPTQFAALVKIRDLGEVTQNQLGRLTAMDPATIQGVVQRLRARDLVARKPDPADRRATLLRLTPEGERICAAAIKRGIAITAATMAPLTATEQATLLALLRRII